LFWWWWWWWYVYRDTNQSVGINKKEKKGKHEVSVEAHLGVGRYRLFDYMEWSWCCH